MSRPLAYVTREMIEKDLAAMDTRLGSRVDAIKKLAKKYGVSFGTIYRRLQEAPKTGIRKSSARAAVPVQHEELKETSEIEGNYWKLSLPKTRIHTLDDLVAYAKIDLSVWEVERFEVNKWEVGMKPPAYTEEYSISHADGEGGTIENTLPMWKRDSDTTDPIVFPLFQVKAKLRKKVNVVAAKNEIELLKEAAKSAARTPVKINHPKLPSGNMLEINIPDAHFGKLACAAETGYGNYDTHIAKRLYTQAFETLLARAPQVIFDEIVFVIGNDLLQSDDEEGRTTKGTYVSTDGRYHKTFILVRETMTELIEKARTRARKVIVIMVPGNHDRRSVWHLGDSLQCAFAKYDDVAIDNSAEYRKYHQFGNVMLMFTHGDKGAKSRNNYQLLMATERPVMFGATKYREAHVGHTHEEKLTERHGVRVRVLPALCAPDDWHAENGLVGNWRDAQAYTWNKNEGLIDIAIFSGDFAEEEFEKSNQLPVAA